MYDGCAVKLVKGPCANQCKVRANQCKVRANQFTKSNGTRCMTGCAVKLVTSLPDKDPQLS